MSILITGITGFVGGHLTESLLARNMLPIVGISRSGRLSEQLAHLKEKVTLYSCDMQNAHGVRRLIHDIKPTQIYHLAGFSNTKKSFQEPVRCWQENLASAQNLFEAVRLESPKSKVLFVSTGLVYGDPVDGKDSSFTENNELRPASPYAASKAACDLMAYQYAKNGLSIIRARPFNHIGPRQPPDFAVANFAKQIAQIANKKIPAVVETGDLSGMRDFTDVRDVVDSYIQLSDKGRVSEAYNIGGGQSYVMRDILAKLVSYSGVEVEVKEKRNDRPGDTAVSNCNASRIYEEIGWKPQYSLDQTLQNILNYWLANTLN